MIAEACYDPMLQSQKNLWGKHFQGCLSIRWMMLKKENIDVTCQKQKKTTIRKTEDLVNKPVVDKMK